MDYIVLDLEWNQPLSYNSSTYKAVGGKLLFEMIQIGAIRLNNALEITDNFNQLIQPTHYVKLHPRIKRITGISQEDLCDAPQFADAAESFRRWCGEDCAILTWGCDDISVLQQNLDFFGCVTPFPRMYDMQRLYGELTGDTKNRAGLKSAMEHFEISPDESLPFHNALNDAYYTALVFQKFPSPEDVLRFPQTPRKLTHELHTPQKEKCEIISIGRTTNPLNNRYSLTPPCPVCGRRYELSAGYVKLTNGSDQALCLCTDHGLFTVTIKVQKGENGRKALVRTCALSEEQNPAYISTKLIQWRNKRDAQQAKEE
ncbi:MAG: exonuclease domain-containing protein [Clostridia bacterium]|nr:exonuclease domain-containing protein [Clostridia bacterium]